MVPRARAASSRNVGGGTAPPRRHIRCHLGGVVVSEGMSVCNVPLNAAIEPEEATPRTPPEWSLCRAGGSGTDPPEAAVPFSPRCERQHPRPPLMVGGAAFPHPRFKVRRPRRHVGSKASTRVQNGHVDTAAGMSTRATAPVVGRPQRSSRARQGWAATAAPLGLNKGVSASTTPGTTSRACSSAQGST